jgi:peptide chain release factor 3
MGKRLKGVYHLLDDTVLLYESGKNYVTQEAEVIQGLDNPLLDERLGSLVDEFRDEIELVQGASHEFDPAAYLEGAQTPVFFGSAINNFGVTPLLDAFVEHAPPPGSRETTTRTVESDEPRLTGFVFKIQANMDPAHRDRIAFMRVCSGHFEQGMKLFHVRLGKDIRVPNALTFMAQERGFAEEAWPGDIIGLHNHGTIGIGDSFTEGEALQFTGIPNFAPELFRRAVLRDPLKLKALQKGLTQLSEEGATQFFRPLVGNDLILGAVGVLQFDVVTYRLKHEYNVDAKFENVSVQTARWVRCEDEKMLRRFTDQLQGNLAMDGADQLVYLAPTRVNLQLTEERWPDIRFAPTRETVQFA